MNNLTFKDIITDGIPISTHISRQWFEQYLLRKTIIPINLSLVQKIHNDDCTILNGALLADQKFVARVQKKFYEPKFEACD